MIILKIEQMINSIPALNELVDADIAIVSAFKIARIIASVNGEMEAFIIAKDSAISKFDLEDEDQQADAQKVVEELLNEEIELNHETVNIANLGTSAVLKPKVLMVLDWLIVGGE